MSLAKAEARARVLLSEISSISRSEDIMAQSTSHYHSMVGQPLMLSGQGKVVPKIRNVMMTKGDKLIQLGATR
jgi:hypothetical protein